MRVVIVGCGRVGSRTAHKLAQAGHDVVVVDSDKDAFSRLRDDFTGTTVSGNAIEQGTLRRAEADKADVFLAATGGDNRNIMTSQMALTMFRVPKVIARIKDPERARIYRELGLEVECRTISGAEAILERLDL
ncbi:MAG TPA: NAD-binding protein [Chloroflexota bacterium]|jgi:trk system potassium uptake protein TrkA|nr:NAD-binding protein [Chloroflexota bacterium]